MNPLPLDYRTTPPDHRPKPPTLGRIARRALGAGTIGGVFTAAGLTFTYAQGKPQLMILGVIAVSAPPFAAAAYPALRRLPVIEGELVLVLTAYLQSSSWVGVGGCLWQIARFGYASTSVRGHLGAGLVYGLFLFVLSYPMLRVSLAPLLRWRRDVRP